MQIQQVVLNLIVNAIQAMSTVEERRRELLIFTRQEQRDLLDGVRDSGVGIGLNDVERLVEPFHTTKPTGMGLSISRSIIHAHGGRIWAESTGRPGATFYFTLKAGRGIRHAN